MRVNKLYAWSIPLTDAGKLGPIPSEWNTWIWINPNFFANSAKATVFKRLSTIEHCQKFTTQQIQAVLQPERPITTSNFRA